MYCTEIGVYIYSPDAKKEQSVLIFGQYRGQHTYSCTYSYILSTQSYPKRSKKTEEGPGKNFEKIFAGKHRFIQGCCFAVAVSSSGGTICILYNLNYNFAVFTSFLSPYFHKIRNLCFLKNLIKVFLVHLVLMQFVYFILRKK